MAAWRPLVLKQILLYAAVAAVSFALFLGAKRLPVVGPWLSKIG